MKERDYYSPAEIVFSRPQIIWIISNLEEIESGRWPPDFKVTGYTGKSKSRRFGSAYFEVPCSISAEIKRRLKFTGKDGKILFWQIRAGLTIFEKLEPEAQMVLNFISLFDFRKRPTYRIWKNNWRYYRKNRGIFKSKRS